MYYTEKMLYSRDGLAAGTRSGTSPPRYCPSAPRDSARASQHRRVGRRAFTNVRSGRHSAPTAINEGEKKKHTQKPTPISPFPLRLPGFASRSYATIVRFFLTRRQGGGAAAGRRPIPVLADVGAENSASRGRCRRSRASRARTFTFGIRVYPGIFWR